MALSPWLILRQASEAVADGRPDEAHRLIEPLLAEGYRKAWRLARDVVKAYCGRAARALDRDNPDAAWRDLLAAEALNTGERCVADLRQALTRLGLAQARAALEAGNPIAAVEVLAHLRERAVRHPDLPRAEEAAQDWVLAAEKADRGDFLLAIADLDRLRPRLPCPPTGLDRYRAEVEARHERFRAAVGRAHEAAEARQWRVALAAAEEAMSAAPEHREARTLRTKAWQATYPETGEYLPAANGLAAAPAVDVFAATGYDPQPAAPEPAAGVSAVLTPTRVARPGSRGDPGFAAPGLTPDPPPRARSTRPDPRNRPAAFPAAPGPLAGSPAGSDRPPPRRFLLWVDGVGGYLVCTNPRVTFGQAALEGGPVDIPLFADVSRVHAELSRDGEGYLIEAGRVAPVNGKEVTRTVLVNGKDVSRSVLAPGDRVTLGSTCQFLFQKPVSVSSTARLELTSGHRLMLPVDGVLLMANELILGPGPQAHVVLPGVPGRVMIYRSKDGLGVRFEGGELRVDDRPFAGRAPLPLPAVVSSDWFTFAVEPVGPRL